MFIIPINRDVRPTRFPLAVVTLIAVSSAALLLSFVASSNGAVYSRFGFIPAQPTVSGLFTSLFVHAGFLHLLGNMWFLWMFGRWVEDAFGKFFLPVYLLCGLGGQVLHYSLNAQSTVPCVGASGAISGIAGIYFILFPKSPFDLNIYLGWWRVATISTLTHAAVGTWIVEQLVLGLLSRAAHFVGIAFWAHIGGFAIGALAGVVFTIVVPKGQRVYVPVEAPEEIPGSDLKEGNLTLLKLDQPSSE